jgi:protoporphyrinogen oxidase
MIGAPRAAEGDEPAWQGTPSSCGRAKRDRSRHPLDHPRNPSNPFPPSRGEGDAPSPRPIPHLAGVHLTPEDREILIVGAGPTGLGAAWRLDREGGRDWLLCEAAAEAGGLASSVVDEHGFTWDLGGHVQFSHYQYFEDLMDELLGPEGWLFHDRSSWVWARGRFVPYPFQLNLRHLPADEQWECVRGLLGLLARPPGRPPENFGEWIDGTFGAGIAGVFLRPYNFKVWAYTPEELSCHWVGDRVAVTDVARAIENVVRGRDEVGWGPNNRFRFPRRGGTGAVWRQLARRLNAAHPGRLRLERRLVRLDTARREARFATGEVVRYGRLLSTLPLDELVAASDLAPELAPALADLRHSSTHVLGIGLAGQPGENLRGKSWMYFPEADCPFYRVTVFSHYSPANVPDAECFWSLMAEVSESPAKPVDPARLVEETIAGLVATRLIAGRAAVHHVWHRRLEHGYPTPSLQRDRALAAVLPAFKARHVFSRGRFGAWKYEVSNQDHSFAQGVEVVERWLYGAPEMTLDHPEVVNARRAVRRAVANPQEEVSPSPLGIEGLRG